MLKVMIVDDEKPIRQWFTLILGAMEGVEIIGDYPNGQAALEACEQAEPDLICTDIIMPVMDGIELIRRIKARNPSIQVLILSNFDDFDYVYQGLKLGAFDYLLKTKADDAVILPLIRQVMERKQQDAAPHHISQIPTCTISQSKRSPASTPSSIIAAPNTPPASSPISMPNTTASPIITQLLTIVHQEYPRPLKLTALADRLHYNADYLSQIFKSQMGKNFNTYVTEIRMEKAITLLLEEDLKINQIARQVGYANEMYFSTAFKSYTGISPRKYLEQHHK